MPILPHDEDVRSSPKEISSLRMAVRSSGLGIPMSLPLERAASLALTLIGSGGTVDLDDPMSVRRAVTIIRNERASQAERGRA